MFEKMASSFCSGCIQRDASIKLLTARLEDTELRLKSSQELYSSGVTCSQTEGFEGNNSNGSAQETPSILQSRKLDGCKGKNPRSVCRKPRDSLSVSPAYSKKLNLLTSSQCNDVVRDYSNERRVCIGDHADIRTNQKSQIPNQQCRNSTKKVKFINSTATQVRYAHLESKDGLTPPVHADARIVYDRFEDCNESSDGKVCGIPSHGGKNKPVADNTTPLYFYPFEQLVMNDEDMPLNSS